MALRTQGLEIPQQAVSLVGNDELTAGGGLELSGDVAASKLELERRRGVVAAQIAVPSVAVEAKPTGACGATKPPICLSTPTS